MWVILATSHLVRELTFQFSQMGSRNWVFTINNPGEEPLTVPSWSKVLVYQEEVGGGTGTHHIQGYIEAIHSIRIQQLKNWQPQGHFEKRRGSRRQALIYVTKEETRKPGCIPKLIGITQEDLSRLINGSSTGTISETLAKVQERISEGATDLDIAEEFFDVWVKYHVAIQKYRCLKTPPRHHETEVVIVYGPTGTGKSRWAFEEYPGAYWKQRSNWWDGYNSHETIIIDEFYGWLPYDLLLRLCDRYPLLLEVKGGQVQCVAKRIIFTSNNSISSWYTNVRDISALKRRVSKVIHMPFQGIMSTYNKIDDVPW